MMKTKSFLCLTLFSTLSFQCSKTDDATTEISLPPAKPPVENKVYFTEDGYSTVSNARLIVNDMDATVDGEFQYVAGFLDGSSEGNWGGSKISEIFLFDEGRVFIRNPPYITHSLMCVVDGWGILYIKQWNLTYSITREANQPEEITISGTGRGSHIYELYWESTDAYNASEILFEFKGTQIEGTNDFEGVFTLEETSPEETYNLFLSGTLTLERD